MLATTIIQTTILHLKQQFMKTKLKYFSLAIAALLLVGFASCSSDDDTMKGVEEDETISVVLKLDLGPTTRAEVAPIDPDAQGSTMAQFNDGHLYFTTAQGAIVKHYTITTTATGNANIMLSTLTDGAEIKDLPANTKHVYVFGNTPTAADLPVTGPINTVLAKTINLPTQSDITNVNLYGNKEIITETTGGTIVPPLNAKYSVTVAIKPTIARLELGKITGIHNITSFSVEGIFIDNYYNKANVDGVVDPSYLAPLTTLVSDYDRSTSGKYTVALDGVNHDWYATLLNSDTKVVTPATAGMVWGYNLFANNSAVPRMVIRMKNVEVSTPDISFPDTQYVTIKGFTNSAGDAPITAFQPGYVYRIVDLNFHGVNLSTDPNLADKDVTVKVEVTPWTVQVIKPVL